MTYKCPAASGGLCGKTGHTHPWRKEQRGYRRLGYHLRLHTGALLSLTVGPVGCSRCISYRQARWGVLGCFWTSLNYLPCIKVKGFRCGRRNNCCYLPFLVPQVGVWLRLQWRRIVLQDICGSLHRTASSKTQSTWAFSQLRPHCRAEKLCRFVFFFFSSTKHRSKARG